MGLRDRIQKSIADLLDWEEEEDRLLPNGMTPEEIAAIEANGDVVDLTTGEVLRGEADAIYAPTRFNDDDERDSRIVR